MKAAHGHGRLIIGPVAFDGQALGIPPRGPTLAAMMIS